MADLPSPDEAGPGTVRAVDRAVAILRCFTVRMPTMSVAQIQAGVQLSRPTVYRLLETLEALGLVQAKGNPQRYRLSHGVMQLSRVWLAGLNLPEAAQPLVECLRDLTGETAALFLLRGDMRLCIIECRSHEVLAMSRGMGDTGPLTEGASGKAILAFVSPSRQADLMNGLGDTERARLLLDLKQAHESGFAVSRGEVFAGAVAVAAPVFDHSGEVAGSIGVFGPGSRMTDRHVAGAADQVRAVAAKLSALLGAPPR